MRYFLIAALAFIGWGCSTVSQTLSTDNIYRADMGITINGIPGKGVLSIPAGNLFDIHIRTPEDATYFTFRTCHREITSEDLPDRIKMTYMPQQQLETSDCPAEIDALNSKGKHSFGLVVFASPENVLPAHVLKCNGIANFNTGGTSVCQAGAGLTQQIEFETDVLFSDKGQIGCELGVAEQGRLFQFQMRKGLCVYTFAEVAKPHRSHQLWTRGYTGIILLEN